MEIDVWSDGHLCAQGVSLGALHEDPDRIRRPMIKVDGQWQEVSLHRAFQRCTGVLLGLSRRVVDVPGARYRAQ